MSACLELIHTIPIKFLYLSFATIKRNHSNNQAILYTVKTETVISMKLISNQRVSLNTTAATAAAAAAAAAPHSSHWYHHITENFLFLWSISTWTDLLL